MNRDCAFDLWQARLSWRWPDWKPRLDGRNAGWPSRGATSSTRGTFAHERGCAEREGLPALLCLESPCSKPELLSSRPWKVNRSHLEYAFDGQASRHQQLTRQRHLAHHQVAAAPERDLPALHRPVFVEKVSDVVGPYTSPPANALVLTVDVKASARHWNAPADPAPDAWRACSANP